MFKKCSQKKTKRICLKNQSPCCWFVCASVDLCMRLNPQLFLFSPLSLSSGPYRPLVVDFLNCVFGETEFSSLFWNEIIVPNIRTFFSVEVTEKENLRSILMKVCCLLCLWFCFVYLLVWVWVCSKSLFFFFFFFFLFRMFVLVVQPVIFFFFDCKPL